MPGRADVSRASWHGVLHLSQFARRGGLLARSNCRTRSAVKTADFSPPATAALSKSSRKMAEFRVFSHSAQVGTAKTTDLISVKLGTTLDNVILNQCVYSLNGFILSISFIH